MLKILKKCCFLYCFLGVVLLGNLTLVKAQVPLNEAVFDTINKDDLGDVDDDFQEALFLAITQRAIENHEKAIEVLLESYKLNRDSKVVNYELAANYHSLDQLEKAEKYYLRVLAVDSAEAAILVELMDLYASDKSYKKAAGMAAELIKSDPVYNRNLAEFYFLDGDYLKSLKILDDLDKQPIYWENKASFRQELLEKASDKEELIAYLEEKRKQGSGTLSTYTDLMFLYHINGEVEKADGLAKKIRELYPDAHGADLWNYKKYIAEGQKEKAVKGMEKAIRDKSVPEHIKMRIIEDFREFIAENPLYENALIDVLGEEASGGNQTNRQKAEYYLQQDNTKALTYFKQALEETPQDYDLLTNTLLLQVKLEKYDDAVALAEEALAVYPTQAVLYLYKGMAENGLDDHSSAEESLLNGIDFVMEDADMERSFYKELMMAYRGLDNTAKVKDYQQKLDKLKNH